MIQDEIGKRILVLDGAMGTMLQRGHSVAEVHRLYIEAGADIIETSTFTLEGYDKTFEAASIARRVAEEAPRKVYVAGSLGPSTRMLSMSDDPLHPELRRCTFDELSALYRENAEALIDAGVDLFLLETVFDPLNAKAALYAIESLFEEKDVRLPVIVSATVNDARGRLLTGMQIEALYRTVEPYNPFAFGINCSFGASQLAPIVKHIAGFASCPVIVFPNAGLPNGLGQYDEDPECTATCIRTMAEEGLINIAGGCCGTTPDHIAAIRRAVEGLAPRPLPAEGDGRLTVTGLEPVIVDRALQNFINVGERTNVAGSRKFARLISEKNYEEAAAIASKMIADGASIIDINMDDPMLDSAAEMGLFLRFIENDPDIARAAVMIDSSDWNTVLAGIKNAPGRCIVNSISLKEGEEAFLAKAREIRRLGAAVIVMAFDENGQAVDFDRKIAICGRAYRLLTEKAGYRPQDIIFDVNILTVGTGMEEDRNYAVDFIRAVRWIKENLPGCHTSGGVSNLSFAFRGNNPVREAMHSVFLYHAIEAGLDMAIVNPGMLQIYSQIEPELLKAVEDVVLNSDPQATERLVDVAEKIKNSGDSAEANAKKELWREEPVEERLKYALARGVRDFLEVDLDEALQKMDPVSVIEGPLLSGMENVGRLFGEGQMFLPQVIKSAKVMRSAVDILQPHIESGASGRSSRRRKMILATAEGDVHDIGKNILSVVLSCNGIEVIDLGVMVDNRTIIDAVRRENADYVGVSGLISPSLAHMEELCRMMEKEGLSVPLFIGGATTSNLHTAVKLAPLYGGPVIHTGNASECAEAVNRIGINAEGFFADLRQKQQRIVELYNSRDETFITVEEARKRAVRFAPETFAQPAGFGYADILTNLDIEKIEKYINWPMFLAFWGFKGDYKTLLSENEEARQSIEAARDLLSEMKSDHCVEISVNARFFDANGSGEEIILADGTAFNVGRATGSRSNYESLADYVAPAGCGATSKVGLFAIKVQNEHSCCDCKDYDHLLRESLCARLAEAAAEWLQAEIECGAKVIRPAFGYPACPDHSLKRTAFGLLDAERLQGLRLTDSCAMIPVTSICGMLICHPEAQYINVTSRK